MEMLVDERKQVRAMLDPVKTRTLARPYRSGRDSRMFVRTAVSPSENPRGWRVEIAPIFRSCATIEPNAQPRDGNLMREVEARRTSEGATFAACLATILELPLDAVPEPAPAEDVAGWRVSR
jgi:hypothetical protein